MTFFTVLFIGYFLYALSKGNVLYNSSIKFGEIYISYHEGKITDREFTVTSIKMYTQIIFMLLLFLIQFIYLTVALSVDPYKYPTIFIILWIIASFTLGVKASKKQPKIKEDIEAFRKHLYTNIKKRTFKGTVYQLISLVYFCFMFYILVFQQ